MKFIDIGNEDLGEDLSDEFDLEKEQTDIAEEVHSYGISRQIENTLQNKVNRGEDLTDEEIYIATETIGNLYSNSSLGTFNGFGFEQYSNVILTQTEKSKIALEAITNQNEEKAKTIKAKMENFGNNLSDGFARFSGNMEKLRKDAKDVLKRIRNADDGNFVSGSVNDKRVSQAIQRGKTLPPFKDYKSVLKALEGNIDSLKIISSASKYESLGSGEGSEYDLAKLAKDLKGRIIKEDEKSATYDLNPEKLNGALLTLKIPTHSENGYIVRNLKANFVVKSEYNIWTYAEGSHGVVAKALTKKECISLLEDVIKHIEENESLFKLYYKDARFGISDFLKFLVKGFLPIPYLWLNSLIFRARMDELNMKTHDINNKVLRGLIAWAASSVK